MTDSTYGDGLELMLTAFTAESPDAWYIEVRYRLPGDKGMAQNYYPVRQVKSAAGEIRKLGAKTDVFVGVGPRTERRGGADAVGHLHAVYIDADTEAAAEAALAFPHPPSLVILSGNGRHFYWITDRPYPPAEVAEANRRLAHHLGGDMNCTDAARVMRAPGTLNFKDRENPKPVTVDQVHIETYSLDTLVGHLPDLTKPARRPEPRPALIDTDDPLLMVTPPEYVEIFTGQEVGRDGKIVCPFHDDRTPSLHVYPTTGEGWKCFGCDRGGTIYDFCGYLWDMRTRGEDFIALRKRIAGELRKVVA